MWELDSVEARVVAVRATVAMVAIVAIVAAAAAVAVAAAAAAAAAACLETLPEVVDLHPEEDREHRITPVQRELKRESSRPAWGLLVRGSSLAWHT